MRTLIIILFALGAIIVFIVRFFIIPKTTPSQMSPFSTFANGGGVSSGTVPVSPTSSQMQTNFQASATSENTTGIDTPTWPNQQNEPITPTPSFVSNSQIANAHGIKILSEQNQPSKVSSIPSSTQIPAYSQRTIRNNVPSQRIQTTPDNSVLSPKIASILQSTKDTPNPFLSFFLNFWVLFLSHYSRTI